MIKHSLNAHVTRRSFLRGVGLLSASAALAACAKQQEQGTSVPAEVAPFVAIIHTNDSHGHDVEVEGDEKTQGNFCMAAVPALKAEWEKKGYEVILVDAGDATQGTPLVDVSEGVSGINFMNACGYDLMTVGNHEFDRGADGIAAFEAAAKFPLISASILKKADGTRRFEAHKIIELADGSKVGFFGITTPETLTTTNPKNVVDFEFLRNEDLYACAQEQVDELRKEGCALVVCVGHLGNEAALAGSTSKDVLQNVTGIDLFIDGHDHEEVEEEVSGTLLVETGCYMHNIGVVVIDEGVPTNQPVAYGSFAGIDEAAKAVIDAEDERVESEMGVVLGQTPYFLDGNREPGLRTQETNLGDFCADAFKWTAEQELGIEVDAAVVNGGALRISIEAGDITLKTIKTLMPFSNEMAVVKVTGAQLLEALEAAYQCAGADNAIGAFSQVSGITCTIDTTVPYAAGDAYPDSTYLAPADPGSRVTIQDVNGRGFNLDDFYTVSTSTFICDGGDTYYVFREAAEAEQPVTFGFDYEAVASYLVEACDHTVPEQYAGPQGRITIIQ